MKEPLVAFKAAQHFSPSKVKEMQPDSGMIDSLVSFPFLTGSISALKDELPHYTCIASSKDVNPTHDPLEFWKDHQDTLPAWAAAARLCSPLPLLQKGCFLCYEIHIGDRQQCSLQDYIEASLMLHVQYNHH